MSRRSGFHELPSGRCIYMSGRLVLRDQPLRALRTAMLNGDIAELAELQKKYQIPQEDMRRIVTGIVHAMGFLED